MNGWSAIQYVGSGLSLVAFVVASGNKSQACGDRRRLGDGNMKWPWRMFWVAEQLV
jgi:hypothetical protein